MFAVSASCLARNASAAALVLLACDPALAPQARSSGNDAPQEQSAPLPDAPNPARLPAAKSAPAAQAAAASSSSPAATRYWSESHPGIQATVLEDTRLSVRTKRAINSARVHAGEPLDFTLAEDIAVDDLLVIPRGATLRGEVVEVKKPGKLTGSPQLILSLLTLDLAGRTYPLYSYQFLVEGSSKTPPSRVKIEKGTAVGLITAGAINLSPDAPEKTSTKLATLGAGAATGTGVGLAVAVASPGPIIDLPSESQIDFYLASPISVAPVSRHEAERLSEGLHSGGPALYVRGERP